MRGFCDLKFQDPKRREEPLTLALSPEYRGEGKERKGGNAASHATIAAVLGSCIIRTASLPGP